MEREFWKHSTVGQYSTGLLGVWLPQVKLVGCFGQYSSRNQSVGNIILGNNDLSHHLKWLKWWFSKGNPQNPLIGLGNYTNLPRIFNRLFLVWFFSMTRLFWRWLIFVYVWTRSGSWNSHCQKILGAISIVLMCLCINLPSPKLIFRSENRPIPKKETRKYSNDPFSGASC